MVLYPQRCHIHGVQARVPRSQQAANPFTVDDRGMCPARRQAVTNTVDLRATFGAPELFQREVQVVGWFLLNREHDPVGALLGGGAGGEVLCRHPAGHHPGDQGVGGHRDALFRGP